MIELARLNGSPVWINHDQIVLIERTPDTLLRMHNGENISVKEAVSEVIDKIVTFQRRVAQRPLNLVSKE